MTTEGFSVTYDWYGEVRTRSYRFDDLPHLTISTFTNSVRLCSGSAGNEEYLLWENLADTRLFAEAIRAIKYHRSSRPLTDDAAAFAEFQEKAKAWRSLPQKPDTSEDVRRYRVQAEDALQNKEFEKAVDCYEKGLEACPLWPEGYFNAALLCGETGMYGKAICHMKRYLELCPDAKDAQAARDKMLVWEGKLK